MNRGLLSAVTVGCGAVVAAHLSSSIDAAVWALASVSDARAPVVVSVSVADIGAESGAEIEIEAVADVPDPIGGPLESVLTTMPQARSRTGAPVGVAAVDRAVVVAVDSPAPSSASEPVLIADAGPATGTPRIAALEPTP